MKSPVNNEFETNGAPDKYWPEPLKKPLYPLVTGNGDIALVPIVGDPTVVIANAFVLESSVAFDVCNASKLLWLLVTAFCVVVKGVNCGMYAPV